MPNAHNGHNGKLVRVQLFRGGQLAEVKGLGDIVIRASIRGIDFVIPLSRTVNVQDGEALGQLAQHAAGFDTCHARHVDVEQHRIVALGANERYRLFSGGGFLDLKAQSTHGRVEGSADRSITINEQNFTLQRMHGPPRSLEETERMWCPSPCHC